MSLKRHLKKHGKSATLIYHTKVGEDDYEDAIYEPVEEEILVEERIRNSPQSNTDERGDEVDFTAEFYTDFIDEDLKEENPRPKIKFEGYEFKVIFSQPVENEGMRLICERVM